MRFSTVCKWMIKISIAFVIIVTTRIIVFQTDQPNLENVTTVITLSPEDELQIYIKNLSSWQVKNDSQIVNPHPYKYLYVPSETCKSNGALADPFVIIIVKSYVSNIGHREAIRETWGKTLPSSVKIVFILGSLDFMKAYVKIESRRYKDIVQEDFIDVYRNNTVKTIMGFNWVVTNCKESPYIFFVDDDYLVNVPSVLHYLRSHFQTQKGKGGLYVGYKWEKAYPKRSNVSKWYVSIDDYPCKYWPSYVGGGSMVISMDVASKMKEAFQYIKPIFIDDVYIGIVAATLGVVVTMEGKFCPDYRLDHIHKLYSIHGFESSSALIQDWNKVKHNIKLQYG